MMHVVQPAPNRDEIRQSVREAMEAAREAAAEARVQAEAAVQEAGRNGPRTANDMTVRIGSNGIEIVQQNPDGTTTTVPYDPANMIPPQVPEILLISVLGLIGIIMAFPIGRAIARFIDRRGNAPRVPDDVAQRLSAIERAVDTVAVEMERMSEANRYTTRLLAERVAAPDFSAGARGADESMVRRSDAIRG